MKRIIKYSSIAIGVVFLGLRFVPVNRANPAVVSDLDAPIEVKNILRQSCYDCHSNEVNWPWYSYVAPVSWLVAYDVNEGREELNFSEWNRYSRDLDVRKEIVEEIAEGEMPLPIYLITHPTASVSKEELVALKQWAGYRGRSHHEDDD